MFRPKKHLGQNFLRSDKALDQIMEAADIQKGDTVLEIGPGEGVLTDRLIQTGAKVKAVEFDSDLIPHLESRFGDTLELFHDDALAVDPNDLSLPEEYKIVANIPYNITSQLLYRFFREFPHASRIVLLVQKEVADRIVAKPGQMSLLSVSSQLYAECSRVAVVPAGAFFPAPAVQSAIVLLSIKQESFDREAVISLAKQGFSSKRKKLKNNLQAIFSSTKKDVDEHFSTCNIPSNARAQELLVEQWVCLTNSYTVSLK